jgi:hypothetical protein
MNSSSQRWYQQPVLWVAAVLFAGSLFGCIGMIVLGTHYPDESLQTSETQLLNVPVK